MAEQAWTPEPWKCDLTDFGSLPFSSYVGVDSEGGVSVAYVLTCDRAREKSIPEWKANARRIVAAVNACAGVSTEDLESAAQFDDEWHRLGCLRDIIKAHREWINRQPPPQPEEPALFSKVRDVVIENQELRRRCAEAKS